MVGLAFVRWEPGVFDVLFIPVLVICLRKGYFKRVNKSVLVGGLTLFIFLLGNVISFFNVSSIERTFWYFFVTVYMILIWFCIVQLFTYSSSILKRLLFRGYLTGAIISILIGSLTYFSVIDLDSVLLYGRVRGFYKDPNVFGPYLIPAFILCLINAFTLNKNKTIWLMLALASFLGIILSFSRGALVNLCIVLVVLGVVLLLLNLNRFRTIKRQTLYIIVITMLCMGVFCSILLSNDTFVNMATNRLGLMSYDYNRFNAHAVAIQVFADNLSGIGPGQTEVILPMSTHNNYLKVLSETGWLGFLGLMLFFTISCVRNLFLILATKGVYRFYFVALLSLIIGQLVNSLVIDSLHWRHLWILLALPWIQDPSVLRKTTKLHSMKS